MQTSRRPLKYQNMLILLFFMKLLQIIASTLKWLTGVGKNLNNNTTKKDNKKNTNNDNADPATPPTTPAPVSPIIPTRPKMPVKPAVPIKPHTTPKKPKNPGTQGNPGGGDLNTRIEQDSCPNRQTRASSGFPH